MSGGSFAGKLRRFFASHEELEAEDLRQQSVISGAVTLATAQPRSRVTLRGTITSITSDARNGWLEAEVTDGTGTVRLVWMGATTSSACCPAVTSASRAASPARAVCR
ncbi:OB-fold nucleic acid binding domain-containing protein [Tessaracoccus sp. HDW20]|uniref:OB-fold nucleic acid binding domain-containing protein n=1 Tax=Tessaracoccus coleopterorum TaxID=2714950 RepID=UPI0018D31E1F|nr:OB-fold nucleic acid binding domain-containing protein [Tessaracoccus coleopterorum]NHB83676.1 OB-fold nucleic acid binding domain-containing protein [Tessaracoccus coleopterorum]